MSLDNEYGDQNAKLLALKASEIELLQGPDAALKHLGCLNAPTLRRAALGILLRAERYKEAADLIRNQKLDSESLGLAVLAYSSIGDIATARELIDQADANWELSTIRKCRLGFAEGVMNSWKHLWSNDSLLSPKTRSTKDIELAKLVIEILDPLLSAVRAHRKITTEYELSAVLSAIYCSWMTRNLDLLRQLSEWCLRYVPVPLIIGELSLRRILKPMPEGLHNRIRIEHSGDFQASFLAAILERDVLGNHEDSFKSLVAISNNTLTLEQSESLCYALFETCSRCGIEYMITAENLIKTIRPEDKRILGLLKVAQFLEKKEYSLAKVVLDDLKDEKDGIWWQAYAQYCEQVGDNEGACNAWENASVLIPNPSIIRRSIGASLEMRQYDNAIKGLKKLLQDDPDNEQLIAKLSDALLRVNNLNEAIHQLEHLVSIEPSNDSYRLCLSQALARTARTSKAIEVLTPVVEGSDPNIEAILLLSELLVAEGNNEKAFLLLDDVAADHWDDVQFLLSYMNRGYAAGKDRDAHEAFSRLLELRREGKVPDELMQEGTLEQLLQHGKEYQQKRENLQKAIIAGQMPWLFAEYALGNSAAWAWTLHTQYLPWLSEESFARAAFSVYSTNSYAVKKAVAGNLLVEIAAASGGSGVVLDISSLLTLYKLGIFDDVASYYSVLLIPESYGALKIIDTNRLSQHQPSRERELELIRSSVSRGRIKVAPSIGSVKLVDEYADDSDTLVYRLSDLMHLLKNVHKATAEQLDEMSLVAHKPSSVKSGDVGLQPGNGVIVQLQTLRTLSKLSIYESVLEVLAVTMTDSDFREVTDELAAYNTSREVLKFHEDLWCAINDLVMSGKIQLQHVFSDIEEETPEYERQANIYLRGLDSYELAKQKQLPLLVDDRVLQVLSYSETESKVQAFGSDALIVKMLEDSKLDIAKASRCYNELIKWRYRFLVPTAEVLHHWAMLSKNNLPGKYLLEASYYIHESLRDPGMHCGLEPTKPPMPIPIKYITAWISSVVTFIAKVWTDGRFEDLECIALTEWAMTELIPSCPRGMWYSRIGHNIENAERFSTLTMAMMQFIAIKDRKRANKALRTLSGALGVDENTYVECLVDSVNSVWLDIENNQDSEGEKSTLCRIIIRNAMWHTINDIDAFTFTMLKKYGLFKNVKAPHISENVIRELADAALNGGQEGHILYVKENNSMSVVVVESLLFQPDVAIRKAAYDYFLNACNIKKLWVTPYAATTIRSAGNGIQSEIESEWVESAVSIAKCVRIDLLAIMSTLRESIARKYYDAIDEYMNLLLYPKVANLQHFRPELWSPSQQVNELFAWLQAIAEIESLEESLTKYYRKLGFLPLSSAYSVVRLLELWNERHPAQEMTWAPVWAWAMRQNNPIARYHAVTIALKMPSLVTDATDWGVIWGEVLAILDYKQTNTESKSPVQWHICCELASHYARHVQSLHPAQQGDTVACYAWWLAVNAFDAVMHETLNEKWFLDEVISSYKPLSYFRSTVARSPVSVSALLYSTEDLTSVWSLSLLSVLGDATEVLHDIQVPTNVQDVIAATLHGYLITSTLGQNCFEGSRLYAFHDNSGVRRLCGLTKYIPESEVKGLEALLSFRSELNEIASVQNYLDQVLELPPSVTRLLFIAMKSIVVSTNKYDDVISTWIGRTSIIEKVLLELDDEAIVQLLDIMIEMQQHLVVEWLYRMPHLLVYCIEKCNDSDRIQVLATYVVQMSVNAGTGSAFERLFHARKWERSSHYISNWRDNIQEVSRLSEPWLASRLRAVSATCSRLIGPRASDYELSES